MKATELFWVVIKSISLLVILCCATLISNAATIQTADGGNWSQGTNWVGGTPPGSSDDAQINDFHNITLDQDATVTNLTIDATFFNLFTVSSGYTLTVTGDLTINSTNPAVFGRLSIQGKLIVEGDIYLNGTTSGKPAEIDFADGGELELAGDFILGTYGRVYSVAAGDYTITLNGSSAQEIASDANIEYSTLVLAGTGTKTLGGDITVDGNLSLQAGTLDADNTNNYDIDIAGNWINSGGTFNARDGRVTFNGAAAQSITSNGNSFNEVEINNTSTGITLVGNMTISDSLRLTDGVVSTGIYTLRLSNTNGGMVVGHSDASFIYGTFRRDITNNTATYAFPVGKGTSTTDYLPAEIVNGNMTTTSYLTASVGNIVRHDDADLSISDAYMSYESLNPGGMWTISPNSQPGSGTYDIRLYFDNLNGPQADNEFGIVKRDNGAVDGTFWTATGTMNGNNGAGRVNSSGYSLRMGLSSFSEFAIGRASEDGISLPIVLTSFDAQLDKAGNINVTWVTATEIDNDYFTIERSKDGIDFRAIGTIEGAGNSTSTLYYEYPDKDPIEGLSYYRLKQTDYNGAFDYSNIAAVNNTTAPSHFIVYPNPVTKGDNILVDLGEFDNSEGQQIIVSILDGVSGRTLHRTQANGQSTIAINLDNRFPTGFYMVNINDGVNSINQKFIVR